jgi:hypothetical protein
MPARFSLDRTETDRKLLEQLRQVLLSRSQLTEIRTNTRKTIAQSRALMALIDHQLTTRP